MKINKIELFNIGSYEGLNVFDISAQKTSGKITVIGGQNGAGKTTLFNAIKLCLYGTKESGYDAINQRYKKRIKTLVNDTAKVEKNAIAYVLLDVNIFGGQDWDNYLIKRCWDLDGKVFEKIEVVKNGIALSEDEKNDFESYLLGLIPPELFNLYFFDGEEIADFFLEDTNGENIKKAFLTICGYDTFNILNDNFKRLSKENKTSNNALDRYLETQSIMLNEENLLKKMDAQILEIEGNIDSINAELAGLENKYVSSGGVSVEEWNQKFLNLKNEERIREEKNQWIKNAANDLVPYIILKQEIKNLVEQMNKEQETEATKALLVATKDLIPKALLCAAKTDKSITKSTREHIQKTIVDYIKDCSKIEEEILGLSKKEYQFLLGQSANILEFDKNEIIKARKEIKKSLKRSRDQRDNIDNSSISSIDDFLNEKNSLLEKKNENIEKRDALLQQQKEQKSIYEKAKNIFSAAEKDLENQLKNKSVNELTAKSILFLDTLQKRLFKSEIEKVENLFMTKMNQLRRKKQFISKIIIDDNFIVHVYKQIVVDCNKVCANIIATSPEEYEKEYGSIHCEDVLKVSGCKTLKEFVKKYKDKNKKFDVAIEFDKTKMSKGEKQVFIMALYWAIMELCNKEVPFIIDTPFARIDTEHRAHITKYFFKELKGQVFIFSTDEEITEEHLDVIGESLQSKFLIENVDNKRTTIKANQYFGE